MLAEGFKMAKTRIEWTDSTWNPVTGCTKISEGCLHCYAERLAKRLKAMGNRNYYNGFQVTTHEHALHIPLSWKKPQNIFVCSMSDLFHEDVPEDFILNVFETMNQAHWHRFQVLTKRSDRLLKLSDILPWANNIWAGVTVENNEYSFRIDDLCGTHANIKFISFEPLIGSIHEVSLDGIDWVILGGESGPGARAMNPDWVIDIRNQCIKQGTPFFFKQWGGTNKKKNGRLLEGRTWDEYPTLP